MTLIVGLTGGIATGKSTVSRMFSEKDIPVLDADRYAKAELAQDTPSYEALVELLGEEILTPSKEINRNKLARRIFKDASMRQKVNDIIHPRVKRRMKREIEHLEKSGEPIVVLDVPLLFETDFHELVDVSVLVYARQKDQIDRLVAREKIDESYARQKIKAQMPLSRKRELADFVIDNSKSILDTRKSFDRVLNRIKKISAKEAVGTG